MNWAPGKQVGQETTQDKETDGWKLLAGRTWPERQQAEAESGLGMGISEGEAAPTPSPSQHPT